MAEGYRTFDHTGDLGLEVWAGTPERLFAQAAIAVLAQVVEAAGDPVEVRVELDLEADDAADLLVHWLNTALLEAELRRAVWTRADVHRLTPGGLSATLEGPRLDPRRQTLLREVKAVSHHGLELALDPPGCRCRIVLDL
jgi:SHS2 domain-containing protein